MITDTILNTVLASKRITYPYPLKNGSRAAPSGNPSYTYDPTLWDTYPWRDNCALMLFSSWVNFSRDLKSGLFCDVFLFLSSLTSCLSFSISSFCFLTNEHNSRTSLLDPPIFPLDELFEIYVGG